MREYSELWSGEKWHIWGLEIIAKITTPTGWGDRTKQWAGENVVEWMQNIKFSITINSLFKENWQP